MGPELLARAKLPPAPTGMAFGGEDGPDPAAYDIMNTDDFGIWQNMTMDTRHGAVAVEASIPGCALPPVLLCLDCLGCLGSQHPTCPTGECRSMHAGWHAEPLCTQNDKNCWFHHARS